jgi:hypothetical protein
MPKPKTIAVAATFTGASGTLGYTADIRYRLNLLVLRDGGLLIARVTDNGGAKRYDSLPEFLIQWKGLERVC